MTGRPLILAALAVTSAVGHAQVNWHTGFAAALKQSKRQGELPEPVTRSGEPFKLVHADKGFVRGDHVEASGAVFATFKGYEIFADRLVGDRRTQVFRLEGNGKLVGKTETVSGQLVVIDFKNKTFSFEDGRAKLGPEFVQNGLTDDVFVRAGNGAGRSSDFTSEKGELTTCNFDPAHYELSYDRARVLPGDKAELRGVRLEILGKTILKIPMLVVPLNRDAPKYVPEVGQSVDEGYYVKTRWSTPLPGENYIDTRLDYMSKLGGGFGMDYNYSNPSLSGRLSAYTITGGTKSRVFTASHDQRVGKGQLNLSSTYQVSDYLTAPSSTLWNSSAFLQLPWGRGASRLSYTRFSSETSGFSSTGQTLGLGDDRSFGPVSSRLETSLTRSQTGGLGSDTQSERLDLRYSATASFRSFAADLLYQRSMPVGRSDNFYASSDITPMLTLRSTAGKLWGDGFGRRWPLELQASVGELINPSSTGSARVTRLNFETGLRRSEGGKGRWRFDWGGRYRQGLYSDDTAQYVLGYDSSLAYNFANSSSASVSYSNLRAFGFTPLAIDSSGRSDSFTFNLDYRPTKALTLAAQTGYDVLQGSFGEVPWQFVWIRSQWRPGDWLRLDTSASYDTFNQAWGNLRLDAGMRLGETSVNLGARYDGLRSQWAGFNLLVDGFRVGKVRTNFLLDYNGYTQRLDSQHYQMIYDLHCAEAVLEVIDNQIGFRSGRTVGFFIRIKAFPFGSQFGNGSRGQSIGGAGAFGFGN